MDQQRIYFAPQANKFKIFDEQTRNRKRVAFLKRALPHFKPGLFAKARVFAIPHPFREHTGRSPMLREEGDRVVSFCGSIRKPEYRQTEGDRSTERVE